MHSLKNYWGGCSPPGAYGPAFGDVGDICMINSILRKHKYPLDNTCQGALYRLGKGYVEDAKTKII